MLTVDRNILPSVDNDSGYFYILYPGNVDIIARTIGNRRCINPERHIHVQLSNNTFSTRVSNNTLYHSVIGTPP